MNIIIKESNRERINNLISDAEKRSYVRKISYDTLVDSIIPTLNNKFKGIPKKYLKGIEVRVDYHAETFSGRYKGIPESTHCWLSHNGSNWLFVKAERRPTEPKTHRFSIHLPVNLYNKILESYKIFTI